MIRFLKTFANSKLRLFCNESYSIELFFILFSNNKSKFGVDEIYNKITLPKPKKSTVDGFIKFLVVKGFVEIIQNKDKRKKTLVLTKKSIFEYEKLKL